MAHYALCKAELELTQEICKTPATTISGVIAQLDTIFEEVGGLSKWSETGLFNAISTLKALA